ncbi:MAG: ZIP family metal transporter [Candidatus Saccharimonadales bacterium]
MTVLIMILATLAGSITSFVGGLLLLRAKKRRQAAILLTLPFGAGALLAAAFFDLLPEAFELGDPRELLLWTLAGFTFFFLLERSSSWFHHHHEHDGSHQNAQQRRMIVIGDIMHNAIDGLAIGAAFLVSVPTGVITAMAVSAHEIPKELGTFALLLSRGWKGRTVVIANVLTALATVTMALLVFGLGSDAHIPIAPLLALTAGFFIYVAASDIIPEIHEQPHRTGTIQAAMLVSGIVVVGTIVTLLGV